MWLMFVFSVFAYLVGSISTSVILSRWMDLPDPRFLGSKNPGATNVLRVAGKKAACLTLAGDLLKGFLPVLLASAFGIKGFSLSLVGFFAVLGHLFPIFLGFKGGKGVATALGVFLGLSPFIGVGAVLAWLLVFLIFRYASLASLVSMLVAVVLTLLMQVNYFLPVVLMAAMVVWRHEANIKRLKAGVESKTNL